MYVINGDTIRQLNKIYGISFKNKYKKELKDRINFFISNLYENKTLRELKLLKEEMVINNLEIVKLTEMFFNKYREELFNNFNPLWYENKEKLILTECEKRNAEANILMLLLKVSNNDFNELIARYKNYVDSIAFFFDREKRLIHIYNQSISRKINKNKTFIKRKEEIDIVKKMIEEDKERNREKLEKMINSSILNLTYINSELSLENLEAIKTFINNEKDKLGPISAYKLEGEFSLVLFNYETTLILLEKIKEI